MAEGTGAGFLCEAKEMIPDPQVSVAVCQRVARIDGRSAAGLIFSYQGVTGFTCEPDFTLSKDCQSGGGTSDATDIFYSSELRLPDRSVVCQNPVVADVVGEQQSVGLCKG